tara:strand:+ start:296 stop:850 length:555 start_codon:yes stop_codon:yes gene_type:complete
MKTLIIFMVSLITASQAFAIEPLRVIGCSFSVSWFAKSESKKALSSAHKHGFNVENRFGWGLPTTKNDPRLESYTGKAELTDGNILIVEATAEGNELRVKASIEKVVGNEVIIQARGEGLASIYVGEGEQLTAMTSIKNPITASIQENSGRRKPLEYNPAESDEFPVDSVIYHSADVYCHAVRY